MPTLPSNTKCSELGCKNMRTKLSALCLEHGGRDTYTAPKTEERSAFNSMYQTSQWKRLRQIQLSKQPLCQSCLCKGRVVQAQHVDHVFPWKALGKEAFYQNIFQSLCGECHSTKTQLESKGIIKFYNQQVEIDYKLHDYARIVTMQL